MAQVWEPGVGYYYTDSPSYSGVDSNSLLSGLSSSALSGALSGQDYIDLSTKISAQNNAFNAEQAQKQMDFQREMSNSAHTREIQDLKNAGINPVLTASGGNGAAVTSGAAASADTSANGSIASYLANLNSALVSLENTRVNAEMQQAIAEKQIASAQLIAQLQAETSRYGANMSYATQMAILKWQETHPQNQWSFLNSVLGGALGDSNNSAVKAITSGTGLISPNNPLVQIANDWNGNGYTYHDPFDYKGFQRLYYDIMNNRNNVSGVRRGSR